MSERVIKIPNPSPKWPDPIWCGFMKKHTVTFGKVKWRKRFFVLTLDGRLFYFKNKKSTSPRKPPVILKGVTFCDSKLKCNCVSINLKDDKPFYVYSIESAVMKKFYDTLPVCGGIRVESKIVEDFIPDIAQKKAPEWDKELVLDWLNSQYLDVDKTFMEYSENLYMNGKDLVAQTATSLQEKGITNNMHAETIYSAIRDLVDNDGEFDYGASIITQKIIRHVLTKKKGRIRNIEFVRGVCREMYFQQQIMSHYLDMSPPPRIHSIDPILQVFDFGSSGGLGELGDMMGDPDSDEMPEIPIDGTYLNLAHPQSLPPVYPKSLEHSTVSKVLLVVSDRLDWSEFENSSTVVSPLMTSFPTTEPPGKLKVGIVIGPWYLTFTKIGLIIPKRINSVLLKMTALYEGIEIDSLEIHEARKVIAQCVAKWNITKTYDPKTANAYHFIEELLFLLGVEVMDEKSPLIEFLKPIEKEGEMGYFFTPSQQFIKGFGLENNILENESVEFRTHKQLDEFVKGITKGDHVSISVDFPGEYQFLKCIDRAFWLSHFGDPKDENYKPLKGIDLKKGKYYEYFDKSDCLFEDPRKSMNEMWFFENE